MTEKTTIEAHKAQAWRSLNQRMGAEKTAAIMG
jgi:hypothetical protein